MAYILDEAGYVTGTYDGPGQPSSSTNVQPPAGAAVPLQFVGGAWVLSAPVGTNVSLLAFYNRFTSAERLDIRAAQASNPVVADFMMLVGAAKFIDLSSPDTQAGVAYLAQVGLLTAARADTILNAAISDSELP